MHFQAGQAVGLDYRTGLAQDSPIGWMALGSWAERLNPEAAISLSEQRVEPGAERRVAD